MHLSVLGAVAMTAVGTQATTCHSPLNLRVARESLLALAFLVHNPRGEPRVAWTTDTDGVIQRSEQCNQEACSQHWAPSA